MATPARFISEPHRQTPVKVETEVLVIGGGTAGVSAAGAAARNGAEVILVERLGYLGGLATGGLIALLLTLDDGRGPAGDRRAVPGDHRSIAKARRCAFPPGVNGAMFCRVQVIKSMNYFGRRRNYFERRPRQLSDH